MSILIDEVRILGFRGISNLVITLARVTVLIGTNNAGKTSILRALHLALGDYSRHLFEEDFHIDHNEKRVSKIQIDIRIIPVNEEGNRSKIFNDEWLTEFGDKIKGGFETSRMTLERWPNVEKWDTEKVKETKLSKLYWTPSQGQVLD
ncbi:MAG: DUF2813 domain-containing protein [Mariprofundales bacterium]